MSVAVGRSAWRRLYGTALLDARTCDDLQADPRATIQATLAVSAASLAVGANEFELGWAAMSWATLASLAQWALWVAIVRWVGWGAMGRRADWKALARALGFARAPGILMAAAPWVGGLHFVVHAWTLAAGTVAVRQTLATSKIKALLAASLGMIPYWAVQILVLH